MHIYLYYEKKMQTWLSAWYKTKWKTKGKKMATKLPGGKQNMANKLKRQKYHLTYPSHILSRATCVHSLLLFMDSSSSILPILTASVIILRDSFPKHLDKIRSQIRHLHGKVLGACVEDSFFLHSSSSLSVHKFSHLYLHQSALYTSFHMTCI